MSIGDSENTQTPSLDTLPLEEFLSVVGQRVRAQRTRQGMSRKKLADVSGVSERYLAQLESGQGNMSIVLLRKVTGAIGMSMCTLMAAEIRESSKSGVTKALNASASRVPELHVE